MPWFSIDTSFRHHRARAMRFERDALSNLQIGRDAGTHERRVPELQHTILLDLGRDRCALHCLAPPLVVSREGLAHAEFADRVQAADLFVPALEGVGTDDV